MAFLKLSTFQKLFCSKLPPQGNDWTSTNLACEYTTKKIPPIQTRACFNGGRGLGTMVFLLIIAWSFNEEVRVLGLSFFLSRSVGGLCSPNPATQAFFSWLNIIDTVSLQNGKRHFQTLHVFRKLFHEFRWVFSVFSSHPNKPWL